VDRIKKFARGGAKLAISAKVPLLPVAHNAGHCWPPHSILKFPGTIQVFIGKPVETTSGNASELTELTEKWIRQQIKE
jgi:1-acyl-sn-glycerol-3-phosphate acyltransferase